MNYISKINTWGNGLGIRLLKSILKDFSINDIVIIDIKKEEGTKPLTRDYFKKLIKNSKYIINNKNREYDLGKKQGREIW